MPKTSSINNSLFGRVSGCFRLFSCCYSQDRWLRGINFEDQFTGQNTRYQSFDLSNDPEKSPAPINPTLTLGESLWDRYDDLSKIGHETRENLNETEKKSSYLSCFIKIFTSCLPVCCQAPSFDVLEKEDLF